MQCAWRCAYNISSIKQQKQILIWETRHKYCLLAVISTCTCTQARAARIAISPEQQWRCAHGAVLVQHQQYKKTTKENTNMRNNTTRARVLLAVMSTSTLARTTISPGEAPSAVLQARAAAQNMKVRAARHQCSTKKQTTNIISNNRAQVFWCLELSSTFKMA